jgi:hypothetical protein
MPHRRRAPHRSARAHRRGLTALLALVTALVVAPAASAYVYWGHNDYKRGVGRVSLDGKSVDEPFIPTVAGNYAWVGAVAVDAAHLYWGNNNPNSTTGFAAPVLARSALDGSDVNQAFTASIGQTITGASAANGWLYWTFNNQDTSGVGRTPIVGGQQYSAIQSTFGEPNPQTCGVAVDDTYVYFANRRTYSIGRAELAGFGTAQQVIDGEFVKLPVGAQPCGVAVDADHLYWGTYDIASGTGGSAIGRAKKDGTDVSYPEWGGGTHVTGVAVDDQFVYWSYTGTGAPHAGGIGRGTKTGGGTDASFVSGLNAPWGIAADAQGAPPAPPTPNTTNPGPIINPISVSVPGTGGGGGNGQTVAVPCTIPAGCAGGGPRPDFSRVWVTKTAFVAAAWSTPLNVGVSSRARTAAAQTGGTVFNYILDRPAAARILIGRRGSGRRVGKTCRKATRTLIRRPACARYATVATLRRSAVAGRNALPFSGRIMGKALPAGSYRAVFSATAAGKTGTAAKAVAFRILR